MSGRTATYERCPPGCPLGSRPFPLRRSYGRGSAACVGAAHADLRRIRRLAESSRTTSKSSASRNRPTTTRRANPGVLRRRRVARAHGVRRLGGQLSNRAASWALAVASRSSRVSRRSRRPVAPTPARRSRMTGPAPPAVTVAMSLRTGGRRRPGGRAGVRPLERQKTGCSGAPGVAVRPVDPAVGCGCDGDRFARVEVD